MTKKPQPDPHYLGHRSRTKEKFLNSNSRDFKDYELLEILLFSTHPRKDTKIIAKELIKEFGNINKLINHNLSHLQENSQINSSTLTLIKIIKEIISRSFLQEMQQKPVINNWQSLLNYCQNKFLHKKEEEFRILFLDRKYQLIEDHLHNKGTTKDVAIDIKEITKKSIMLCAEKIILTHNHPTGKVTPSKIDITTTSKIIKLLKTIEVKTIDHLIIGPKGQYYSFKENGLI